jgi:hypothetical protein
MEINKLPQLKNKNFLESEIRRFTTVRNIIDKIEEENYNKFNQIDFIKKTNLLEKKKQNYSVKNSRFFSVKHYLPKNNSKVVKKIENQLLKKKLKIGKKPKLIYYNRNSFKDELISPLNHKYQSLISNIDYNKRCFRNLSNKDFDSIFKDKSNLSQKSIKKRNILISTNYNKKLKKQNIRVIKKKLRNDSYRLSSSSNKYKNSNNFENRIKNIKASNCKKVNNDTTKSSINNKNNTFFKNYEDISIVNNKVKNKLFNAYINYFNKDKKYGKFVFLLKKQNDKNMKLLNDVKKEQIMNRDNLLVSIVKLNGYKSKKNPVYY